MTKFLVNNAACNFKRQDFVHFLEKLLNIVWFRIWCRTEPELKLFQNSEPEPL
jgi:hypothetical protein